MSADNSGSFRPQYRVTEIDGFLLFLQIACINTKKIEWKNPFG